MHPVPVVLTNLEVAACLASALHDCLGKTRVAQRPRIDASQYLGQSQEVVRVEFRYEFNEGRPLSLGQAVVGSCGDHSTETVLHDWVKGEILAEPGQERGGVVIVDGSEIVQVDGESDIFGVQVSEVVEYEVGVGGCDTCDRVLDLICPVVGACDEQEDCGGLFPGESSSIGCCVEASWLLIEHRWRQSRRGLCRV